MTHGHERLRIARGEMRTAASGFRFDEFQASDHWEV